MKILQALLVTSYCAAFTIPGTRPAARLYDRPIALRNQGVTMSSQKDDLEVLLGSTTGVDTTRRSLIGLLAGFHALSLTPSSSTASVAEVGGSGSVGTTITSVFEGTINKSPSDPRSYRALTLANGLNVLLVTDPLAEGEPMILSSDSDPLPTCTAHSMLSCTLEIPIKSQRRTRLTPPCTPT